MATDCSSLVLNYPKEFIKQVEDAAALCNLPVSRFVRIILEYYFYQNKSVYDDLASVRARLISCIDPALQLNRTFPGSFREANK